MRILLSLILCRCFCVLWGALPSNFYYDIDGVSIGLALESGCVLEAQPGTDIGGRAHCWATDEESEVEHNAIADKTLFVQIVGGSYFICGLDLSQTVSCWGHNLPPFLKNVPGLYSQISAGGRFICGVMTDGRLNCIGNSNGALGFPRQHHEKFVQVSCAQDHCCALDANGHASCWGGPFSPRVITPPKLHVVVRSDGSTIETVKIVDESKERDETESEEDWAVHVKDIEFKQISVASDHVCGIEYKTGDLHCWGDTSAARVDKRLKKPIQGPFRQVSAGMNGVCAIHAVDDTLHCFGGLLKMKIPESSDKWDQVKLGFMTACAVNLLDSRLSCWGGIVPRKDEIYIA